MFQAGGVGFLSALLLTGLYCSCRASCFQSLLCGHQLSDQPFNQPTGGAGVFSNDVWWVFICLFLTVASWLWVPSMQVVQVQPGPTIQLNIRIDSPPQTMNSLKLSQAQILTTSKYAITILRILILTKCYKTVMLELLGVVPSGCDSIQGTVYLQPLSVSWVASFAKLNCISPWWVSSETGCENCEPRFVWKHFCEAWLYSYVPWMGL